MIFNVWVNFGFLNPSWKFSFLMPYKVYIFFFCCRRWTSHNSVRILPTAISTGELYPSSGIWFACTRRFTKSIKNRVQWGRIGQSGAKFSLDFVSSKMSQYCLYRETILQKSLENLQKSRKILKIGKIWTKS